MEVNFERGNYSLRKSKWNRVNVLSKLFFTWLWPLYYKAFRQNKLQFEDVYACPPEDASQELAGVLEKKWKEEVRRSGPKKAKFRRALYHCFVGRFIPILLSFMFQELVLRIGQAYLLGNIINNFANEETSVDERMFGMTAQTSAIVSAVGFVVCAALSATMNHFNITLTDHVGMQMKIACSALLYQKSLRLSQKGLHETSVGQVSNLLANDVNRMVDYAYFAHSPVVATLQLAIVTVLLWRELNWSCLPGLAIFFFFIPIQGAMGKLFQSVRSKTAPLTDQRIRIISEIVCGIKLIKMYAWERAFIKLMSNSRLEEVRQIRRSCNLKGVHLAMYYVTSRIVLFVCFIVYVYLHGGQLTAHKVFVSMALFNTIRIPVTRHLPQSIAATAELMVACQRIQKFLLLEQVESDISTSELISESKMNKETAVVVENASGYWDNSAPAFQGVGFTLKKGELLTIVGPVGSGKTSLLLSLMGELPIEASNSGRATASQINTFGCSIAYVPQKAWVFMGTIRENVLFGRPFEEKQFWEVLRLTALDEDIASMPLKERTLVGEKGYKLSGGQKARVNLARALYADADLYLLDDPISALDTKVARYIMERCILHHLHQKTVILVTHQVQFIPQQASVLILDKVGKVVRFVRHDEDKRTQLVETLSKGFSATAGDEEEEPAPIGLYERVEEETADEDVDQNAMMTASKSHPYQSYFKGGFHWFNMIIILLSVGVSQVLSQGCDYLLSKWTDAFTDDIDSTNLYAYIYTGLIVGVFLATFIRAQSFFSFCMNASTKLYNKSFDCVLRSPITFFYINPAGRILNRFSRDIGIIDDYIPMTAFELQISITDVLATLVIEIIIDWKFTFPAVVFLFLMWAFSVVYLKTARELKRLEGIARNPIFSHINTTFDGLTVIRCFSKQSYFEHLYYRFQDFHTSVYFSHICATRGFAILIEWLCVAYIGALTALIMLTSDLSGSLTGLSLSSSILLVGVTSWGVECRADLESYMSSVERVAEYTKLPVEFDTKQSIDRNVSPFSKGSIAFKNVSLSYNGKETVLKDLDFEIKAGESIGVVGRTGAGKTSIITALFRLVHTTGDITIDGVNIGEMNLEQLRANISSIPQDPVLFTGSIRSNIDLFGQFEDAKLWQALEEVQLKGFLIQTNKTLDSPVYENGANFSVGQRQLLCLARAMLQRNRIIILDEATSNIDNDTDEAIQKVIRTKFAHCTVITVAHRINTIIDFDRILVLEGGRIVEYGMPHYLLSQNSAFASLVDRIGGEMATHLRHIAKNAYIGRLHQ